MNRVNNGVNRVNNGLIGLTIEVNRVKTVNSEVNNGVNNRVNIVNKVNQVKEVMPRPARCVDWVKSFVHC